MNRFLLISGLPGSGKSTLARRLAPALHLPLFDKDSLLDQLFDSQGIGDAAWRRALSRQADRLLQQQATAAGRGVLVSHWHAPGMPADSGTPVDWLPTNVLQLHCICDPALAARRFFDRRRHPGHLDAARSYEEVLASIHSNAHFDGLLEIGPRIDVETGQEPHLDPLLAKLREADYFA